MSVPELPATCRSCQAPIRWVTTTAGRRMPIDPTPSPGGNVVLREDHLAAVLAGDVLDAARAADVPTYLSHFATCPHAAKYRDRKEIERARR